LLNPTSSTTYWNADGTAVLNSGASSTLDGLPSGLNIAYNSLGAFAGYICSKFPFSYVCDFGLVLQELDQTGDAPSVISMEFPSVFGKQASTTAFVILDPATIQSGGTVPYLRTAIEYALWLMFGFVVYRRILVAF